MRFSRITNKEKWRILYDEVPEMKTTNIGYQETMGTHLKAISKVFFSSNKDADKKQLATHIMHVLEQGEKENINWKPETFLIKEYKDTVLTPQKLREILVGYLN